VKPADRGVPSSNEERSQNIQDDAAQARTTLLTALRRYSRATSSAELQLSILAMHEGLRQVLRVWLLRQPGLTPRQREAVDDVYSRMGELLDIGLYHTDLFQERRNLWVDEMAVLLDRRNEIAHPVSEMALDTALAAASGWADLIRRMWPYLLGGDPPDLRHPDSAMLTGSRTAAAPRPSNAMLSFYAEPTPPAVSPKRVLSTYLIVSMLVLVLLGVVGLFALSQLLSLIPQF
jgi:hypothetical protein